MTQLQLVLRNARQQKSLSLGDMEKLSDRAIARTYVKQIEEGAIPSPQKLRILATILKLDFLELMVLAGHVKKSELKRGEA